MLCASVKQELFLAICSPSWLMMFLGLRMDSARDTTTNQIIEAEFLWELEVVDKERYACIGCGTQVWPASYKRGVNKKRPYFTLGSNGAHIEPCDIDGEEEVVKRAKVERIGTVEGFPLPYPNKLVLTDERQVVRPSNTLLTNVAHKPQSRGDSSRGHRANHGHTVKTLRPIAKAFIKYPHDRETLPLQIPNCEGVTFSSVFWRLNKLMKFRSPTHLFYAPLHWKAPSNSETHAEWQLNAGDWDAVNNRRGTCFKVKVDWSNWSPTQRNTLLHEIEVAREVAKESGGAINAWLFFVATQDAYDQTLLSVNRYQLICCIEGPKQL